MSSINSPEHFFENALKTTYSVFDRSNICPDKNILLAGLNVRIKFAGQALIPIILPAIAHLIQDEENLVIDYTIFIWDSTTNQTPLPTFNGSINDIKLRGEIAGYNNNRYQAAYFTHARMLSLLDMEDKIGVICLADLKEMPSFEIACPLRSLFSWIIRKHGRSIIHAGAVGSGNGAVLIGGQSGSGKSSTSLRCLLAGLDYLGDDLTAISLNEDIPIVYSLYSSGKTHNRDLETFSEFKNIALHKKDAYSSKEIYLLYPHYKNQLTLQKEIKAVLIPDLSGGTELKFSKISLASVLSIMCSSTKELLPDTGNEIFFTLASILHKVPCYRFYLGADPAAIPKAIQRIINNPFQKN